VIDIAPLGFGPAGDLLSGYIEDVAVLERYRRRGIGSALIRRGLAGAWEHNAQHVRGIVTHDRIGAVGLYQKLGFAFVPDTDARLDANQYIFVVRESWIK
jgi:ribosomal protein S18 acetylase RimI-like enzyme